MAPRVAFLVAAALLLLAGAAWASNEEGDALYALRMRLSDPNGVLQSWDPTLVNPCTWFHVTCDHASRVVRLDLGNSNISGSIGPELGHLLNLQYLELYRNNLGGEIPNELGNLKNLISLDLYANKLTGRIPKSLSKLNSLRFMRLNNNKLAGSIPRELAKLSNLKVIDLSNNALCGTIPVDGPFSTFPLRRMLSSQGLVMASSSVLKRNSDDTGWEFWVLADTNNLDKVKCKLCEKDFFGGVYKLTQHIGHVKGNVSKCPKSNKEEQEKCRKSIEKAQGRRPRKLKKRLEIK